MIKKGSIIFFALCLNACVMEYADESDDAFLALGVDEGFENDSYYSNSAVSALASQTNLALQATATAQSTFSGYSASRVNDGDTNTTVGGAYSWTNAHSYGPDGYLPQWLQLDFGSRQRINEVHLYTSNNYEIKEYDIQYWNGSSWVTVVDVNDNTQDHRVHTFSTVSTNKIRVVGRRGPDNQFIYVRINELEVYGPPVNLALQATATAQSTFSGYSASRVNDGDTNTTVGGAYSWANAHSYGPDGYLPQWLQLDFGSAKSFSEVHLYTSNNYEIKEYDIQYWNGSSWVTVVDVNDNTQDHRVHTFSTVLASKLRVVGRRGPDNQFIYVRVNELEVY